MSKEYIIIMVMCASRKEAAKISDKLLKQRLVACANTISGIGSKFWWKGKIDSAKETLVILKTTRSNFKKVETEIRQLHSYEIPEIIAIPIIAGSFNYLTWIRDSVHA